MWVRENGLSVLEVCVDLCIVSEWGLWGSLWAVVGGLMATIMMMTIVYNIPGAYYVSEILVISHLILRTTQYVIGLLFSLLV